MSRRARSLVDSCTRRRKGRSIGDRTFERSRRGPDESRVDGWRNLIHGIRYEVAFLEWYRNEFRDFENIVEGSSKLLNGESYFPAHIKFWYIESQVMRIRRLVEPSSPGYKVYSLLQLLEDMRRATEAFGRSEIVNLFDAPNAPNYDSDLKDFLVESMWKSAGDVESGSDRLRSRQIKDDIKALRDATAEIKRYADLLVAHNALEKPQPVKFSAISDATDEIVRITKRYLATLTGISMVSFAPIFQGNWFDIFGFPWLAKVDGG